MASSLLVPRDKILKYSCQYTDFGAYANILAGAAPSVVQRSVVGRHKQTWKLREYHLLTKDSASLPGIDDDVRPLPGGDPLKAYFPHDAQLRETKDGLTIRYSGSPDPFQYYSFLNSQQLQRSGEVRVRDVIIIGEVCGHANLKHFLLYTLVTLGTFCMGPVQISGPCQALRWFHQFSKRLCTFFLNLLTFEIPHKCVSTISPLGEEASGCIVRIWLGIHSGPSQVAGEIH